MINKLLDKVSDIWYTIVVNPVETVKYNTKWFLQRKLYGFDDREIWSIDITFYKWLLPRLKKFRKKANGYPEHYRCMSSWEKELVNRITQLQSIVRYCECEYNFPNSHIYLDDSEIKEYKKTLDDGQINCIAYNKCIKNFNKWFCNNVNNLWY